MIISDLEAGGLDTIFRKGKALTIAEAEDIYFEHSGNPHYEASIKSIRGEDNNSFVTVLILRSNNGDALVNANKIKGLSNAGGLRLKYRVYSKQDLENLGYSGERLMNKLAENRLHVPESDSRSMELIEMVLSNSEKEEIQVREPELFKELEQWRVENKEGGLDSEKKRSGSEPMR